MKIPMRDKVELNATLYLPHNPNGRTEDTPLVFTLRRTSPIRIIRRPRLRFRYGRRERPRKFWRRLRAIRTGTA